MHKKNEDPYTMKVSQLRKSTVNFFFLIFFFTFTNVIQLLVLNIKFKWVLDARKGNVFQESLMNKKVKRTAFIWKINIV